MRSLSKVASAYFIVILQHICWIAKVGLGAPAYNHVFSTLQPVKHPTLENEVLYKLQTACLTQTRVYIYIESFALLCFMR